MIKIEGMVSANSNGDLRQLVKDLLSLGYELVVPIRDGAICAMVSKEFIEIPTEPIVIEAMLASGAELNEYPPRVLADFAYPPRQLPPEKDGE